jgi:hypothetical protein
MSMTNKAARAFRVLLSCLLLLGAPAAVANPFYTATGNPTPNSAGSSALMREEFALIQSGFDLVPQILTTGAYVTTFVQGATITITLPLSNGTLSTLAGAESLSNKTIVSPLLLGVPTAPTAAPLTDDGQVATTQYVDVAVNTEAVTLSAATAAVSAAVANETTRAETAEALLAPKASPTFTGTPVAPTASPGTSTVQLATTAFDTAAVAVETARAETAEALLAPLASPALTGAPTAPTAAPGTNTTQLATTAFVKAAAPFSAAAGKIVLGSQTIAWGQQLNTNGTPISYGVTFSGAPFVVVSGYQTASTQVTAQTTVINNGNFSCETWAGVTQTNGFINWIAIGPT